jgi:predicted Zn-dependent peptidase
MSSRLFQRVREELGLAYAVYSFQAFHRAAGTFGVYLGTRPGAVAQAVEVVRSEMARLAREGLPDDELERARAQVKGQVTLALESTGARLHRLAGSALRDEPVKSLDEFLACYDAVTPAEVAVAAEEFMDPRRLTLLGLGPASPGDGSRVFE